MSYADAQRTPSAIPVREQPNLNQTLAQHLSNIDSQLDRLAEMVVRAFGPGPQEGRSDATTGSAPPLTLAMSVERADGIGIRLGDLLSQLERAI